MLSRQSPDAPSGRAWPLLPALLMVTAVVAGGGASAAASFPPIQAAEKNLAEVPGSPGASAVMLKVKAEFWMMDTRNQRMSSRLEVWRRIKVLTPEGVEDWGEVEIRHNRQLRFSNLEARTVLPDGRELKVDKDAVFRRRSSKSEREYVTGVAFPAVEPGAILDLRYDLTFDSIFYLEPWYFQSEIPTLHSEIEYHIPSTIEVAPWGSAPPGEEMKSDTHQEKDGRRVRIWMENLPGVPDEPYGWPAADLMAKFMLVPKAWYWSGQRETLMDTWEGVCELVAEVMYRDALRKDGGAKKKAKELAAAAGGQPRAVAESLYRFVRDEIQTQADYQVFLIEGSTVDGTLSEGRGTFAEKSLLLHAMLDAAKLDSELVWVPDRRDGRIDANLPNPDWFERVLVRLELPGEGPVLLDPTDRRLAFGALTPYNEGMPALIFSAKKPEMIEIPLSSAEANTRRAEVELAVDEGGKASGSGRLELSGHHAWFRLAADGDGEALTKFWQEWLEERFAGWEVSEVAAEESVADRRLRVTWQMAQREEEVLGDELSLEVSRPLGPVRQLFQLEPERRKTPVLMAFGDLDEVKLHVRWPEGWEVETSPRELERKSPVGEVHARIEIDPAARELTYERSFKTPRRELTNSQEYQQIRALYSVLEKHDAQALVLVAR